MLRKHSYSKLYLTKQDKWFLKKISDYETKLHEKHASLGARRRFTRSLFARFCGGEMCGHLKQSSCMYIIGGW